MTECAQLSVVPLVTNVAAISAMLLASAVVWRVLDSMRQIFNRKEVDNALASCSDD